jgi:hypothetical protein
MEIKGKVHEIGATQQVTDSFKKRELIVEYIENPQYPEYIKFEAIQDRCALLDLAEVGDSIEVHFNLKGRTWTDKTGKKTYFNSLQLWKVSINGKAKTDPGAYVPEYKAPEQSSTSSDDDDLPF